MSEVRLVIREAGHDWSGTVHGSAADRAIAALSADPVTLTELATALARYEHPALGRRFFANLSVGLCDEPHDAGIVIIDLTARLVVVDSTYSSPGLTGAVCYHDGQFATEKWLPYHLAEDWLFVRDRSQWQAKADQRRKERAACPLDARSVFYGRPLLEFIARETFAADARDELLPGLEHETIKQIHAAWLLTPHDDLGGNCPRDLALARQGHLTWDLQDQADRWSRIGECPPGLDESSFAFRYGGFGTHELVQHYELVRGLLWSCQERLARMRELPPTAGGLKAFSVEDFLASEIPRLESVRDEWLSTPDPECHGRTRRSIIDRERARLPEGMSGHDAIIDPDCPCCQMLADMPGPVFWHLDECNMDDGFAFDIRHRTREEWEADQRKWEEHRRRFDAEMAERRRLGITDSDFDEEGEHAVWTSGFSVEDAAEVPMDIRLFGICGHLAELIVDIRGEAEDEVESVSAALEAQRLIDQLNRNFSNLRELLQSSVPALADALIEPVIDRCVESLAAVASTRRELSAKCQSLTDSLSRLLNTQISELTGDADDADHPF